MRQTYPSDVSREQFENIRSMLESARKVTHPRTIDVYDIFCAVLLFCGKDAGGVRYRMIFRSGKTFTSISRYGQSLMRTAVAYLIR